MQLGCERRGRERDVEQEVADAAPFQRAEGNDGQRGGTADAIDGGGGSGGGDRERRTFNRMRYATRRLEVGAGHCYRAGRQGSWEAVRPYNEEVDGGGAKSCREEGGDAGFGIWVGGRGEGHVRPERLRGGIEGGRDKGGEGPPSTGR